MAAITYTKVYATDNQLVYSFTGDAAGTRLYAELLADTVNGSTLKAVLTSLAGECGSNANAFSALVTGGPFTGTLSNKTVQSDLRLSIIYTTVTTGKSPCIINAVDGGAGNSPDLVVTPDAQTTGLLFITHRHSIIV